MSPRLKSTLLFAAKLAVAAVLIGWLVRSGAIDFGALGLYFARPSLLVGTLVVFLVNILLSSVRWSVLLRLADAHLPFWRTIQLQLTSVFFNIVIPGNVGGDVIKAIYAARAAPPERKATVYLVGFVDRLLGLAGLVLVAALVILSRGPSMWNDPRLHGLVIAVFALAAATLLGPALALLAVRYASERLEAFTSRPGAVWRIASQLVLALRLVTADPKRLVISLSVAMVMHAQSIVLFTAITRAVLGRPVPFSDLASLYPIGMLTIILPISPAGIGVGHYAFDRLFAIAGLTGGATVFNIFLVGQIVSSLLGVFPYLTLRREKSLPAT